MSGIHVNQGAKHPCQTNTCKYTGYAHIGKIKVKESVIEYSHYRENNSRRITVLNIEDLLLPLSICFANENGMIYRQ